MERREGKAMFLAFFILWIILNAKITLEIIIIGLIISTAIFAFICKFMDYSVQKEIRMIKKLPLAIYYVLSLLNEIIKANIHVIHLILSEKMEVEPQVVTIHVHLKTNLAKVLLANAITLTPGTITVTLEGDEYTVHCLDKDLAEDLDHSIFVKLLERLEAE